MRHFTRNHVTSGVRYNANAPRKIKTHTVNDTLINRVLNFIAELV